MGRKMKVPLLEKYFYKAFNFSVIFRMKFNYPNSTKQESFKLFNPIIIRFNLKHLLFSSYAVHSLFYTANKKQ